MSLRYPNSGVNAAYYNPIACLPNAPTIGTATATGTSVSLTFTASTANGGNPITCYIATSNVGGFTGANTGSPISITGLTKNTGYSFTVAARTATGTGPSSSASNGILAQGVPNAPTIGTASVSATTASITFTAPACNGGNAITSYTATSCPGGITGTSSSSPVSVSGLTVCTTYTFKVKATNGIGTGPCSAASNSVKPVVIGSQSYTSSGTYTWVAPAGVTKVSVVTVGAGGNGFTACASYAGAGGGGGALAYKNNISVTPGNSYTVVVANRTAYSTSPATSYFCSTSVVAAQSGHYGADLLGRCNAGAGGVVIAGSGNSGGHGGIGCAAYAGSFQSCRIRAGTGGGGAGGYSGAGGRGTGWNSYTTCCGCVTHQNVVLSTAGSGGGGGGGGMWDNSSAPGGGGGGVGILGQGSNGAAGGGGQGSTFGRDCGFGVPAGVNWGASGYRFYSCSSNAVAMGGGGGSGGANGYCSYNCRSCFITNHTNGGGYGGGGGGGSTSTYQNAQQGGYGGSGAVRIVWPGNTRTFPSTCVGSP
jgi:hypothetical protein